MRKVRKDGKDKISIQRLLLLIAVAVALLILLLTLFLTMCTKSALTFEVDGEVYVTVNATGEETLTLPEEPEKDGYVFDGWYWDKDIWEQPFTGDTPLTGDGKLYAKWKPAHEHSFGEWEAVTPATCITEGQRKRVCSCGAEETAVIEKIPHTYETKYNATNHWEECSVCHEKINETAHSFGAWEVVTAATCMAAGQKKHACSCGAEQTAAIQKLDHSYEIKHGVTNHWEECSVCHETINATAHTYGDWTEVTAASCTAEGQRKRVCSVCAKEETEVIEKLPHTFSEWTVVTQATCTVEGLRKRTCSVCETEETAVIEKLPHTYEIKHDAAKHWEECSVCHETINATAHTFDEWTVVTPATCTAEGQKKHVCTVCRLEETAVIPVVAHNYATKYDDDNHWKECTVCGDVKETEAHTYENEVCTVCGRVYGTQGLAYTRITNGYSVSGIGTADNKTKIEIPSKYKGEPVTEIDSMAFIQCDKITSIEIPNSVTRVGRHAFRGCENLTAIEIPKSVTSIGIKVFSGCSGLKRITVAEGNTAYRSAGNCIIETATKTLIEGSNVSVIPTDGSVTSIGSYAFSERGSLQTIVIPDSVTSIGEWAFQHCGNLQSVTIGNGVTSIGGSAFLGCGSLTCIAIPQSVTSIDGNAFSDCGSLVTITVAEGNTKYHSAGNCIIETETKTLFAGCNSSVIPSDGTVTSIGDFAFQGCSSLIRIEIPNNVTSIGLQVFFGCVSLESIVIPNGVTNLRQNVINGCGNLKSIVFRGTKAEWKAITKETHWNDYTGEYTVTCTDGTLTKAES